MGRKKAKPRSPTSTCLEDKQTTRDEIKDVDTGNISYDRNDYRTGENVSSTDRKTNMVEKQNTGSECLHEREDVDDVFPRHFHWTVFVLTLAIRLWYVVTPSNWWILHPDEIFQTVEVAHSEAFGYGFRPFEYLPPPGNATYSAEHAWMIERGMYSMRSFLLVKILSIPLIITDILGIPASPYLVIKVVHAVVTSFLPIAVFKMCRAMCWPRDVATLSAIFTSFSLILNVFGTHTLINSFISPFLFFSLIPLASAITLCGPDSSDEHTQSELRKTQGKTSNKPSDKIITNGNVTAMFNNINKFENQNACNGSNGYTKIGNGCASGHANGHIRGYKALLHDGFLSSILGELRALIKGQSNHQEPCKIAQTYQNGHLKECSGSDINANVVKKPYVSKCNGHTSAHRKSAVRTNASVSNAYSPRISLESLRRDRLLLGFVLGICVYIRTDAVLIPLVTCLTFTDIIVLNIHRVTRDLLEYAVGSVFGVLIGGYMDSVTYGVWFISMKQWFRFNFWESRSASVFGEQSIGFYVSKLVEHEPLTAAGCSLLMLDAIITIVFYIKFKSKSAKGKKLVSRNLHLSFFAVLFIYSLVGHKEVRFLHNGLVLLYISLARTIYNICKFCLSTVENQSRFKYYAFIYTSLTLLFSSHIYSFINLDTSDISKWTYGGEVDPDVNICMDFIRRQDDVTGVFMDRSFFSSAAYSALHKDVSIFALNKHEFVEYNKEMRDTDSRFFSHNISVGFSTIGRIGEFVSVFNTPYVVKILILKPEYNYVVLLPDRRFIETGYTEVFQTTNARVLKRSFIEEEEEKLNVIAKRIPIGTNATILEYEGDWLRHFGLYNKAEQRLIWSNRIDKTRLGPFQVLLEMFEMLGHKENYNRVLKACLTMHKRKKCLGPYVRIQLHSEYFTNNVHIDTQSVT